MYPLNDNDLDRLSREAADQYDVEPSTSGWEALETRLNRELPLKEDKERRRFLFWLFLIVLLAGGGVLYTMTGNNSDRTLQLTGSNTVPANEPGTAGSPARQATAGTTPTDATANDRSTTAAPEPTQQTVDAPARTATAGSRASTNGTGSVAAGIRTIKTSSIRDKDKDAAITSADATKPSANNRLVDERKNDSSVGDDGLASNAHNTTKGNSLTGARNHRKGTSSVDQKARENRVGIASQSSPMTTAEIALDPSFVREPGIKAGPIGPIKAPVLTLAVSDEQPSSSKIQRKREPRGFELALIAGPDMSNVKFTDMDKLGYNAGFQIGYRFNNRWSVNTGFQYTHKNYTAQGKDFTKPNYGWWQRIDLTLVKGYCEMYELPLNVRYDFSVKPHHRWYASAGASSYFMKEENYNYDYIYTSTGAPGSSERYYDSSTNYIFSILNLSIGYERTVGKRLSVQAEPYFKIPTKGLGFGKLNLNSYGIYFGLKYKLHK